MTEFWFKLANRLGMSVSEAKHSTTATEFIQWQWRFLREFNEPERADYYAAQIAFEISYLRHVVANLFNSNPPEFPHKVSDFIIKFKLDEEEKPKAKEIAQSEPEPETVTVDEEDRLAKIERSKAAWMGFLGYNVDGTPVEGRNNGHNQNRDPNFGGR